jgi:hypothetical protein
MLVALATLTMNFLVSIYLKYRFQQLTEKLELYSNDGNYEKNSHNKKNIYLKIKLI